MGVSDPIFLCELALEMRMPIGELGRRMSNYELTVVWPLFFAARRREQEREVERQHQRRGRL
jgi:hypothetical protein